VNTFRAPNGEIKLNELEGGTKVAPEKVQLLRVGKFEHDEYGTFEITTKILKKLKENFDAKVRGVDLAIDFSHDNHKEAAAWIKEVELSEDETQLWAIVDWTTLGKAKVEGKEYRYLSAEFSNSYKDTETGKSFGPTLFGAGLTNRPFIKNMAPAVELKEQQSRKDYKMEEELKKEIAELKEKLSAMESEKKELADAKGKLEDELKKSLADKELAEKESEFTKLLSEGQLCPAQKEAFMKNDIMGIIKNQPKINLSEKGTQSEGEKPESKDVEDMLIEEATKLLTEKKADSMPAAIKMALSENKELSEKYNAKFA
jgi:superfamily I DNA and/or RNA helicase